MKIAVIGGGSWGTALASHCATIGHDVKIWVLEKDVVETINTQHENKSFLPEVSLPESLVATNNLADAVCCAEIILSVVPTQFLRSVVKDLKEMISPGTFILSASKGIENETLDTPTSIYQEILAECDCHIGALAGPSFAKEVAAKTATAVVVAAESLEIAAKAQHALSSEYFRIYTSTDVVGLEFCGALKNVIAIASGAVTGLGLGDNTRAALITRGLTEIYRLVDAMGGSLETVAGLAGLGDMVLTCTSSTSRNFTVGYRLGKGESIDEITSSMNMVAEGVKTTKSVNTLMKTKKVELPISRIMYEVLYKGLPAEKAVNMLMTRDLKQEW